jgi:RNA polymerase sigma-70 factor (ECF subfamily)
MPALDDGPSRILTLPRRKSVFVVVSPPELSDEDLLVRISAGDRTAFEAIFNRYAPRVKSYLMRLGAGAAAAEDLAQEAMISVWRRAASYDAAKAKPSTWVFVIARNAWIDRLRREKVALAYQLVNPPIEESQEEAPDAAVMRRGDESRVVDALAELSEEQRQVVRLSFFEDNSHSEIAARLSLPLGTVKSRLRLALIKLRAHWEQYS